MIALLIVMLALIVGGLIVVIVIIQVDWRALFQARFGDNYRNGEAVDIINGKRVYFNSTLWHEDTRACSYWRHGKVNGVKVIFDDIIPNPPAGVPIPYDANGRRMYWLIPGGVVASNSEISSYQFTNYSPELMSSDIFDRTAVKYGTSVKSEGGISGIWIIVGIVVILAIAGLLIFTNGRHAVPASAPASTTQTTNATGLPPGGAYGVPVPSDQGGQ